MGSAIEVIQSLYTKEVYYFRMMPFGLAPACWVFTKIIRVLVDYWRSQGLACLSYIDDGVGAAGGLKGGPRQGVLGIW